MKNPPAFQFYAADFMIGIMGMSDEEIGIYMRMLCTQWIHGALPNCPKTIKKLINSGKKPSEIVLKKFDICDDGMIRNARMEEVREKQRKFVESRRGNANNRWNKNASDNASALLVHCTESCTDDALQSSSSSSNNKESHFSLSDEKKDGETKKRKKKEPFTKPTIDDLKQFARKHGLPPSDGESMFYHWEENGWMNGRNPVKSWESGFLKWKTNRWLPSLKNAKLPPNGVRPVHEYSPVRGLTD